MTTDTYRLLPSMPPYDEAHDLEPVGTHADHRRRGLARAVNLAGLALLRRLGAIDALVLSACPPR
jgi:hypothetical protein